MTNEQLVQLRFSLATQLREKSVAELEDVYKWVIGPQSNIIPVSEFKVVKQ